MTKPLLVFVNLLIFALLVAIMPVLDYRSGSFGDVFSLVVTGLLFGLVSLTVEPIIKFFKFPINFWGLLVVGFLTNLIFFLVFSLAVLPQLLLVKAGSFAGGTLAPIPFPEITLASSFMSVLLAALVATLLQILFRKLASN